MIVFWHYLAGFAAALAYCVILTRWLRTRGPAWGLLDRPVGPRRRHGSPVPVVGGVAIVLAIVLALAVLGAGPSSELLRGADTRPFLVLIVGALAMHIFGVVDDLKEMSAGRKLLGQIVIAVGVFLAGVRVASLHLPAFGPVELSFWPSLLATVLWLVAITNAFNLVDGADGVATGTALVATLVLFAASLFLGHGHAALVLAVVAGALLGFLYFNFPPASVFLGDGGSLFLGFLLAGLGVVGSIHSTTGLTLVIPLLAFGLPVTDMMLVVLRRTITGAPIARADRRHIHHRLLDLGHSPRQVAWILYAACALFGLASLVVLAADARLIALVLLLLGCVLWFGIRSLQLPEWRQLVLSIRGAKARHWTPGTVAPSVRLSRRVVARIELALKPSIAQAESGPSVTLREGGGEARTRARDEAMVGSRGAFRARSPGSA